MSRALRCVRLAAAPALLQIGTPAGRDSKPQPSRPAIKPAKDAAAPFPSPTPLPDSTLPARPRIVIELEERSEPCFARADAAIVADSVPEAEIMVVPPESVLSVIASADALVGHPIR
ncbi:MAG TPA: hypothetical protein VFM14_19385 [Gemmatimonadales bacterium]|nr:hypothetical protein [Gemmatimonadales bacterium]